MHRSELQQYGSEEPIWRFVAQLGAERFTGHAEVGEATRIQLFTAEGRVYLAEHSGDAPIGARLVAMGALTDDQLARGEVHLGDVSSLARLFHRAPDVDRDVVEVALGTANEAVLEAVANDRVGRVALYPLRHHPSGVHQWNADLPPLPVHDDHDAAVVALVAAMQSVADPAPEPVDQEPVAEPEPVAEEPVIEEPAPPALPTLGAVGSWVSPHPHESAAPAGNSPFTPADLDQLELPKLSSRPMSVGEITAAHAIVQAEKEAAANAAANPVTHTAVDDIPTFEELLGTSATDWSAPTSPPAAEEIWDMVDEMLGLPHQDEQLVGANGGATHEDKKGRGWLRGRKG